MTFRFARWLVVVSLVALAGQTVASERDAASEDFAVIGYLASWRTGTAGKSWTAFRADRLTHIVYAFGAVDENGLAALSDPCIDVGECPAGASPGRPGGNFAALSALKRANPRLHAMIALGGWTGSKYFSSAAATAEGRSRLAASAIDIFLKRYDGLFDGIDLDWEFPVTGGMVGNQRSVDDRDNLSLLLAEFRRQLAELSGLTGRRYELSIAVSALPRMLAHLDLTQIGATVDRIGLMAYDYHAGSLVTNFNAPLSAAPSETAPRLTVEASVDYVINAGVPSSKLVLGMPFYGRAYENVLPVNDGLYQPGSPTVADWGGTDGIPYRDLMVRKPEMRGFHRYWSEEAQVPWLYNARNGIWISYDDPASIAVKVAYARDRKLAGIMAWELSSDDGSLLNAIDQALAREEPRD